MAVYQVTQASVDAMRRRARRWEALFAIAAAAIFLPAATPTLATIACSALATVFAVTFALQWWVARRAAARFEAGDAGFTITITGNEIRQTRSGDGDDANATSTAAWGLRFLALAAACAALAYSVQGRWGGVGAGLAFGFALTGISSLLGLRRRDGRYRPAPGNVAVRREEITHVETARAGLFIRTADPARFVTVPAEIQDYAGLRAQLAAMGLVETPVLPGRQGKPATPKRLLASAAVAGLAAAAVEFAGNYGRGIHWPDEFSSAASTFIIVALIGLLSWRKYRRKQSPDGGAGRQTAGE